MPYITYGGKTFEEQNLQQWGYENGYLFIG